MLMMVVDALLSRVIAQAPTVLVVDDVQWADPATGTRCPIWWRGSGTNDWRW